MNKTPKTIEDNTKGKPVIPHRRPVVGVFDSGVGGLTVFREIEKGLPGASYVYCSDNENFPYGPKAEQDVVDCVRRVCNRLIGEFKLDLLVIACNTASTVALPVLRSEFRIPVVGVVPAIKPAALATKSRAFGLLATPGTVKRDYVQKLIREFADGCRVVAVGSSALVTIAEDKAHKKPVDLEHVRREISALFAMNPAGELKIDTVVLGCTHFPLLIDELKAAAPWSVQWIDSGAAVAARTRNLLIDHGFNSDLLALNAIGTDGPTRVAVVTKDDAEARLVDPLLSTFGFKSRRLLGT